MDSTEIFTRHTRLPLEQAIELIEAEIDNSAGKVSLTDLKRRCRDVAPEAEPILDHTIKVFIRGGFVQRRHEGPGSLSYVKTELWSNRNEVLVTLRAPVYKYRYRSYESRKRSKRTADTSTVDSIKKTMETMANAKYDRHE